MGLEPSVGRFRMEMVPSSRGIEMEMGPSLV